MRGNRFGVRGIPEDSALSNVVARIALAPIRTSLPTLGDLREYWALSHAPEGE